MNQELVVLIDETIEALSQLDHERLQALQNRVAAGRGLHQLGTVSPALLDKQRLLKLLLEQTQKNLSLLTRLRASDGESAWAR